MEITLARSEDTVTFALAGRLDSNAASALQDALIPTYETAKAVVLDFQEISYIASAGLRVLFLGEKTAKAKSAEQTLVHVSPDIMEVFEMTGFTALLHIE